MTPADILTLLRSATEDDVTAALVDAYVALPITTEADALEMYNVIIGHMINERAAAEMFDDEVIGAARARRGE